MNERTQKAVEIGLRRRAGASPEAAKAVAENMLAQADLRTDCRGCGARRVGTLAMLTQPCPVCGHDPRAAT